MLVCLLRNNIDLQRPEMRVRTVTADLRMAQPDALLQASGGRQVDVCSCQFGTAPF